VGEPTQQRLHRSVENKQISGLVRVLWAAITLFTGVFPGLVLYIVMAAVLPVGE
jgi:phage shock protein PspC (stress-responsive transcriptional regulator)